MKTYKVLLLALIVSAVLSVAAQAGNRHGNSGSQVSSAPARSSASSFRSSPGGNFSGGRMISPSQRFSSVGVRSMPTTFRQHYINSTGNASVGRHQFTPGTLSRGNGLARFNNTRSFQTNPGNRFGNIQNARQNRLAQNQNLRSDRPGQFGNGGANRFNANGNRNPGVGAGGNHVFARRDADWHRDWDRHSDHWWHGHRCRFVNNSWFIFDLGFFPWYGYPYDYYASDYYYPYGGYPYSYDPGVYQGGDPNYYGQGTYDSSDQSDATVAAAQEQLAREGYYRGNIDGVFGPETQRAVMRYQAANGLRVTGYLTRDTLQSLGLRRVASY